MKVMAIASEVWPLEMSVKQPLRYKSNKHLNHKQQYSHLVKCCVLSVLWYISNNKKKLSTIVTKGQHIPSYLYFYTVNSRSCENLSVVVILKEINNVSRTLINYSVKDETFRVELVSVL